jgi:hypothetical protein
MLLLRTETCHCLAGSRDWSKVGNSKQCKVFLVWNGDSTTRRWSLMSLGRLPFDSFARLVYITTPTRRRPGPTPLASCPGTCHHPFLAWHCRSSEAIWSWLLPEVPSDFVAGSTFQRPCVPCQWRPCLKRSVVIDIKERDLRSGMDGESDQVWMFKMDLADKEVGSSLRCAIAARRQCKLAPSQKHSED